MKAPITVAVVGAFKLLVGGGLWHVSGTCTALIAKEAHGKTIRHQMMEETRNHPMWGFVLSSVPICE